jgi:hypothetical protein
VQAENLLSSAEPQLKEFNGDLQQTIEDLRNAVQDNTR